ncbi:MAG: glycoside hydrolase family 25 protein [Clostridiales bacterium]|nr:glycoside hydrolase family 25 protein [Clostridiales bacterium]
MAGRRERKATVKKRSPWTVLLVLLALLAAGLLAAVLAVGLVKQRAANTVVQEAEQEETGNTVTVGGQEVEIDEELPQSNLEEAHFTVNEDGTVTYSGEALYGIDVSAHQGEIDWAAVAADGVEFAILRIGYRGYSEGTLNQDSQFAANYEGATANGMTVGVYFFSQAVNTEEAEEEAQQVLSWLEGLEIDGPVVFDWEEIEDSDSARTNGLDGETVTACARAFCDIVQEAGYTPMVYCNGMLGYLSYDLTELEGVGIWYAEYSDYPSYAYQVEIWQYSNTGTVDGVSEQVDRNIWFRDLSS